MERLQLVTNVILAASVLFLGGLVWSQNGRIADLEDQLDRVDARAVTVRGAPSAPASADPLADEDGVVVRPRLLPDEREPAPSAPEKAPAAEPDAPAEVAAAALDPQDPEIRGELRQIIAEEEEARRSERRAERDQRRQERLEQTVAEMSQRAGLDGTTEQQLTDLLVVEQAEASEIFRQAREDFSWPEAREQVSALREETDEKASELLSEEELAEYEKMREEEASRWGRGRGGGTPATPRRTEGTR